MPPRRGRRNVAGSNAVFEPVKSIFSQSVLKDIFDFAAALPSDPGIVPSPMVQTPIQFARDLALVCKQAARWMRSSIWQTVHLTSGRQTLLVAQGLRAASDNGGAPHPMTCVRNLWVGSRKTTDWWQATFADAHLLQDSCKIVGDVLMKHSHIRNLAIDLALLNTWFRRAGGNVKPTTVLLLDSVYRVSKRTISHSSSIFGHVTHMVIEPFWTDLVESRQSEKPFKDWPSLTHVCLRFPSSGDPTVIVRSLDGILSTNTLRKVVICVDAGLRERCMLDNPVWERLLIMFSMNPRIFLLPFWNPMEQEWAALCDGDLTIWERARDPEEWFPIWERTQQVLVDWQQWKLGGQMDLFFGARGGAQDRQDDDDAKDAMEEDPPASIDDPFGLMDWLEGDRVELDALFRQEKFDISHPDLVE